MFQRSGHATLRKASWLITRTELRRRVIGKRWWNGWAKRQIELQPYYKIKGARWESVRVPARDQWVEWRWLCDDGKCSIVLGHIVGRRGECLRRLAGSWRQRCHLHDLRAASASRNKRRDIGKYLGVIENSCAKSSCLARQSDQSSEHCVKIWINVIFSI